MSKFRPNFVSVLEKDPPQGVALLGYYPDTERITIAFWNGTRTDTGVPLLKDANHHLYQDGEKRYRPAQCVACCCRYPSPSFTSIKWI